MHKSKNSKITLLLVSIGENLSVHRNGGTGNPPSREPREGCGNRPASLPWLIKNDDIPRWNGPPYYKGIFCIESVR